MPSKLVRVELGPDGRPIRIFRDKSWRDLPREKVLKITKAEAVKAIRTQVFRRSFNPLTGQFECGVCGRTITWTTGEMNEKRPRGAGGGKTGGEVSLENCEALCHDCHQGNKDSAHGDRMWQTAKLDPKGS